MSSNKQRILITGVSGLIGRILFNYFTEKYPDKYELFGLDQHLNIFSRNQAETNDHRLLDKFFQCDVTDRIKLFQIIEEYQIEIIIHLAAILENHPDLETIFRVNIEGTKNVFEAPGVDRIIFASTITTCYGYLKREPYLSLYNDTFDDQTMTKDLRKLTVDHDRHIPGDQNKGILVYSRSKIIGEQMAKTIGKDSRKSIICARLGWINPQNQPGTTWERSIWLSYRDLCSFFEKAIEASSHISGTYFVTSNNHRLWVDLDNARRDLGYVPRDRAERLE